MSLKVCSPNEAVITHHLDGPICQLAEQGCPVFVAAVRLRPVRPEDTTIRIASGWGASAEEARRGCLFEAAERTSAQFFGTERLRRASFAELAPDAVPPPDIMLFAEEQFRGRIAWNKRHPGLNEVPKPWRSE